MAMIQVQLKPNSSNEDIQHLLDVLSLSPIVAATNLQKDVIDILTDRSSLINELQSLLWVVDSYCSKAAAEEMAWEQVYTAVFSENVSLRVYELCNLLGRPLKWYDPDATYQADTEAFENALTGYLEELGVRQ